MAKQKKGHPIRNTFILILAVLIILGATACAVTYFDIFEIPIISKTMAKIGLLDSGEENEIGQRNSVSLDGAFTDQKVTDAASAAEAAKEGASQLGLGNALDNLSEKYTETVDGQTYYRLQQNYNGIPVYGRSAIVLADEDGQVMGMNTNAVVIPDSLSTKPTVDKETIKSKISAYASENWDGVTSVTISAYDENDLVIYPTEDSAVLAYCLKFDLYEIIVDAKSGEVLSTQSTVSNESKTAYNSDKSKTFAALFKEDKYYVSNEENNINVFYMDGDSGDFDNALKEAAVSDNSIFGDTEVEKEKKYDDAVNALECVLSIRSTFEKAIGTITPYGQIDVYYNDSYENGINARGGWYDNPGDKTGWMLLGSEMDFSNSNTIKVITHEYTHVITYEKIDWVTRGRYSHQTEAINEGLSDLFACMITAEMNNTEPDWLVSWFNVNRDASNPRKYDYPSKVSDENTSSETDGHAYATVVSRSCYLMYNGGSNGNLTKIPLDTLENLWYRTMNYLPSNANFADLRSSVVKTAGHMGLSREQTKTVENAFDEVGIEATDDSDKYGQRISIQVTDKNGKSYDNYVISVDGWTSELLSKRYQQNYTPNTDSAFELELPNGSYMLTISDGADASKSISKKIKVRKRYSSNSIELSTNFGFDYTAAPGAQMTVLDFNGELYDNYQAKVSGHTITDGVLNLNEGGYRVTLTDSKNSNRTETFLLRIKNGKTNSFSVQTNFGKFNESDIPEGAYEWNDHYYYAVTQEMTWYEAEDYCERMDGYLVTLTSQEENEIIKNYISQASVASRDFWIGATDEEDEGNFSWVTGESFVYSNWGRNEPDDNWGEDCAVISNYITSDPGYSIYPGEWDDVNANDQNFFICEWGAKDKDADSVQQGNGERVFSDERNVSLVIDNSGSMDGSPLDSTKNAASRFVQQLAGQTGMSLISFDDSVEVLSDFTTDTVQLNTAISDMSSGGGTNIESGLASGFELLKDSGSAQKYIVLMSDGMPNEGKEGDDLISYAENLRNYDTSNNSDHDVIIYTLGFFDSLSDSEKVEAQNLLEQIADTGHHFEVESEEDLAEFFTDIANEINGTKYIYVRIACPVDVTVSKDGEILSSSEDSQNTRTSFGSLTFEKGEDDDDDTKILRLIDDGSDYNIEINGTGRGTMDYTLGLMDEDGNYSDVRRFRNIDISRSTVISSVAANADQTILKVDADGDGKTDIIYEAGENEYGQIVDHTTLYIVLSVLCAILVILIILLIVYVRWKRRRSRRNID